MTEMPKTDRETCYFCNSEGPLETHHIVPRRYDGSDHSGNLVDLCPTCHKRLEDLYTEETLSKLGDAVDGGCSDDSTVSELTQKEARALFAVLCPSTSEMNSRWRDDLWAYPPSSEQIVARAQNGGLSEHDAEYMLEVAELKTDAARTRENDGREVWRATPNKRDGRKAISDAPDELLTYCFSCGSETIPTSGSVCRFCGDDIESG